MAKKQVLQIKDFSGGVNSYSDPRDLQENEFQILDNAVVDEQGIIRVSGGLEIKDIDLNDDETEINSSLPVAGKGLFSHKTDYIYHYQHDEYNFNNNLETDGGDSSNAWGVVKSDGDGTWAFEQTTSNANGTTPNDIGAVSGKFAINYDEYSAGDNKNHGTLSFNNVPLKENTNYTLKINIVSEKPWYYLGSNIPPRVRLYSPTDSLYYHPSLGFTSISDATHDAICNDNIGNLIDSPTITDNPDKLAWSGGNGTGHWEADDSNGVLTRAQISDTVPAADNHEQFNSLFGTITISGDITNGYALKMQGAGSGLWHASNTAFSSNLTVVESTKYLFDAFYFTVDEQCSVRIKKAGTTTIIWDSGTLDQQSGWTHISGNISYPQPIIFETPSGCTSISIEVTVAASGNEAYFAGFNIRKNVYEISKLPETSGWGGGFGSIGTEYVYPNLWANEKSGAINSNPYINDSGYNSFYKKIRFYELSFYTGYQFTDNKFTIVIDNGIWGVANETGTTVNNILIESVSLFESDVLASFDPESSIYKTGRGNLIFYNSYIDNAGNESSTTKLALYQYRPDVNKYENISNSISLPSVSGRTNFNFFKSGEKVLFCDEGFADKALYEYGYNKRTNSSELLVFDVNGLDISHFVNSTSNGIDASIYDALEGWLGIHHSNNQYLSMIAESLASWWVGEPYIAQHEPWPFGLDLGNTFCQHSTDNDGTTVNGNMDIDHDDSSDRFQYDKSDGDFADDEQPYAKYITIPSYDIAQVLTSGTRVGKIAIDFSHWMLWGWLVPAGGAIGDDYIPKMDVYIDIVSDAVITGDGTSDYTGDYQANHHDDLTSGKFVTSIAHLEVNPNNLRMGSYSSDGPIPGTLGYYVSPKYDWRNFSFPGSGSEGQAAQMFKSNEFDANGERPLRVEFDFPYDFSYVTGGGVASNLTVHATTGTNFQIRIVPQVDDSLDFATQGTHGNHNCPRGILSECWKIDGIKMQSWKASQSTNLSSQFLDIGIDEFGFNMAFETPSAGEADGWEDEWTPTLTRVDYNGIESAFGNFDFTSIKNTDVTKCPGIGLTYHYGTPITNNVKLIKGYMKSLRNSKYNLQFVIDTDKKTIKSSSSTEEIDAVVENNLIHYSLDSKYLLIPNEIDSYESETGVLSENALSAEKLSAIFKTAIIANNTLYAGNIYQDGKTYPDRMIKSPIGKSPLLPSTNFIDVAINDGDEITCIQFYKDRLLQFKKEKLFIISTSEDYEYLEDTIDNVGVSSSSQVTMTPYGVVWINERGCYLYDGQKVNNLTDGKIAYKKWKDSESTWEVSGKYGASITYLKKDDKIIIYGATKPIEDIALEEGRYFQAGIGGDANQLEIILGKQYLRQLAYQYDFKTKSWINLTNFRERFHASEYLSTASVEGNPRLPNRTEGISNFTYDENGDSIFMIKPSNLIMKWNDNPKKTIGELDLDNNYGFPSDMTPNSIHRDFRVITKDYDFGAPSVKKKVYKVYVTFKSTDIESNKIRKVRQNQDEYSSSKVGVYYAINGTNNWTEFSETKSKNYGAKGLISDDSETTTTLSSDVSTSDTTISVASASNIKVGYVLIVGNSIDAGNERMLVVSIRGTTITVDRNYSSYNNDLYTSWTEGAPFLHASGDTVAISTGDWIVSELKASASINKIDSFKLKFETKKVSGASNADNGVPPGFMINDISVIYRTKNVK